MAQSNEPSIEAMNEAIALFDGWQPDYGGQGSPYYWKPEGLVPKFSLPEQMKYHTSWDWLMPVIEKIEQLNDGVVVKIYTSINGKSCSLWNYFDVKGILRQDSELNCPFSQRYTGKTKIEATHKAVYQFIQWYNQQKQNNEQ